MSTETSDFEDDFDARDALNDLIEDLPSREASGLHFNPSVQPTSSKDSGVISKTGLPKLKNVSRKPQNYSVSSSDVGRIKSHPLLKNQNSPRNRDFKPGTANSSLRNLKNFKTNSTLTNSSLRTSFQNSTITKKPSIVAERVASARRKKQSELINLNMELSAKNDELLRENKLLKAIGRRQENSLKKYENLDEELPTLINQHSEQRRVDKANLRESRRHERQLESQMQAMTAELNKKESLISRMKAIVEDRDLRNADELKRRLIEVEREMSELREKCDKKDKKYNLDVGSLERQLKSEKIKSKQYLQEINHYQKTNQTIQTQLRAKERAITDMSMRNESNTRLIKSPKKSNNQNLNKSAVSRKNSKASTVNSSSKSPKTPKSAASSENNTSSSVSSRTRKMANLMTKNTDDRVEKLLKKEKSPRIENGFVKSPKNDVNVKSPPKTQQASPTITNVTELPAITNVSKLSLAGTSKWGGDSTMITDINTPRSMGLTEVPSLPPILNKSKSSVKIEENILEVEEVLVEANLAVEESQNMKITPQKKMSVEKVLSPPLEIKMVSSNECTPSPSNEKIGSSKIESKQPVSPTLDDLLADTPSIKPNTGIFQTEVENSTQNSNQKSAQNPTFSEKQSKPSPAVSSHSLNRNPSDLETILSAPAKHNRKPSAKPSNTSNIASVEDFNDFLTTDITPISTVPQKSISKHSVNQLQKSSNNNQSPAFSPLKAKKIEYNFSPEVNNLYKGHPAQGPLDFNSRKNSFDEIFKPKKKIPNNNKNVNNKQESINVKSSSAESIFGVGDNSYQSAVQQNSNNLNNTPKFNYSSQATKNRAKSPMHIEDDLEEIFY